MRRSKDTDSHASDALDRALRQHLKAIEKEDIPDRLLELARQLQDLLREKTRSDEVADAATRGGDPSD